MIFEHLLTYGLFYSTVVTGYLFLLMVTTSPRVWGYADYSETVKNKVPPQTKREKTIAALIGLPWIIFVLGFPIFSTYALKSKIGEEIPFWAAFLNLLVLFFFCHPGRSGDT